MVRQPTCRDKDGSPVGNALLFIPAMSKTFQQYVGVWGDTLIILIRQYPHGGRIRRSEIRPSGRQEQDLINGCLLLYFKEQNGFYQVIQPFVHQPASDPEPSSVNNKF